MIDQYYWPTPNGRKISVMLEEYGLGYEAVPVDIGAGEQKERPAVRRGIDVGKDWKKTAAGKERAHAAMFGQNADTVFEAAKAVK